MAIEKLPSSQSSRFSLIANVIAIAANIAVIVGITAAFVQIRQANQFEQRRVAVEATAPTKSTEFLTAYSKLMDAYERDNTMFSSSSLFDDLTYVMNVYDDIAILYLNGLADKDLVKQRVRGALKALVPILNAMKWPAELRRNFDGLLRDLEKAA